MTQWVRTGEGDIRLSYVVRKSRDPALYEQLRRIPMRGGTAAVLREALHRLMASGELAQIIDAFLASHGAGVPSSPAPPPRAVEGAVGLLPEKAEPSASPPPSVLAPSDEQALNEETVNRLRALGGRFLGA